MSDRQIRAIVGIVAWLMVIVGADLCGGLGLGIIAIGLPIMIYNWELY